MTEPSTKADWAARRPDDTVDASVFGTSVSFTIRGVDQTPSARLTSFQYQTIDPREFRGRKRRRLDPPWTWQGDFARRVVAVFDVPLSAMGFRVVRSGHRHRGTRAWSRRYEARTH